MKVLLYAPNYLPAIRYGGPVRSSHGLAKALVDLGHSVHVFTTNVDGPGVLDVPLDEMVDIDGVKVRYFSLSMPKRLYYTPAMGRALEAEACYFDVIHINGTYLWPGPMAGRVATSSGVPHLVSPRGMLMPELIAGKSTIMKHAWITLQERRNLETAQAIHVTSEEEARGVQRLDLDLAPLAIIANGVTLPSRFPPVHEIEAVWRDIPAGKRVAFLGRLDWTKGLDLAIGAVRATPRARIVIAGPDQIGLRRELEPRLVCADGTVIGRFIGALEDTEKWALLAGADVLIAPSLKESFGMAVGEALSLGIPVICTEGVGAAAIVRQIDAKCVVPRTTKAIAHALGCLLTEPARRERFCSLARSVMAEEYTWLSIAGQMEKLYESAIADAYKARSAA